MVAKDKQSPGQQVLALLRVAAARLRPALLRLARWQSGKLRLLTVWVGQHRRAATASGVGAALAAMLLLMGVPGRSPERQVQRQALSGQELFTALCDQNAGIQRGSRVEAGDDRSARTNLVVLPEQEWRTLAQEQRNSLGSWLNTLGGRWEIRVGKASADGLRVLEAEAVITSRQWNQQLK